MIKITESKMVFEPYEEDDIFEIEKSKINQMAGDCINTVEFVLVRDVSKILFVEAKSSTPRESTDKYRYEEFITEIKEKFIHSFELYQALRCQRYDINMQIGTNLKNLDWKQGEIKFVFVIHGHQKEWLPPIREALLKAMDSFNKIWKSDIIVLNDEMAMRWNLVSELERIGT